MEDEEMTCESCWFGSRYEIDPGELCCLRAACFDCVSAGSAADKNCPGFRHVDEGAEENMEKKVVFKTKIRKDSDGRELVGLPKNIAAHHCQWLCSEFYRKKELRDARRAGRLPDVLHLDDLPPHVTVERGALLATVCVNPAHGS